SQPADRIVAAVDGVVPPVRGGSLIPIGIVGRLLVGEVRVVGTYDAAGVVHREGGRLVPRVCQARAHADGVVAEGRLIVVAVGNRADPAHGVVGCGIGPAGLIGHGEDGILGIVGRGDVAVVGGVRDPGPSTQVVVGEVVRLPG